MNSCREDNGICIIKSVRCYGNVHFFSVNKSNTVDYICSNNDGENSLVSPAVFVPQIHIRDKRAVFRKRDNSK